MRTPKRKRIPPLSPDALTGALLRLQSANISADGKRQIEGMLRAASNPDGESIDVAVRSLDAERRNQVLNAAQQMTQRTNKVLGRAAGGLVSMPQSEWDALVEQANGEK